MALADDALMLKKAEQLPDHLRATAETAEGKIIESQIVRWCRCSRCKKWRRLSPLDPFESLKDTWQCVCNSRQYRSSCKTPEEKLSSQSASLDVGQIRLLMDRERAAFLNDLFRHLRSLYISKNRIPVVARQELDLYRLYREITYIGGYEAANQMDGSWAKVFRRLENYKSGVS